MSSKSKDILYFRNEVKKFKELDWNTLKEKPMLAPGNEDVAFSDFVFSTPSGKIELYSQQASELWNVNPLPEYVPLKEVVANDDEFYLLSPNTKNRIHSQFGNLEVINQFDPEPKVEMNPDDAQRFSVEENDLIQIFNNRGSIKMKVGFNYSLKKQCLVIYNGLWIKEGCPNFLSAHRETDMGHGTAFNDNVVKIKKISI